MVWWHVVRERRYVLRTTAELCDACWRGSKGGRRAGGVGLRVVEQVARLVLEGLVAEDPVARVRRAASGSQWRRDGGFPQRMQDALYGQGFGDDGWQLHGGATTGAVVPVDGECAANQINVATVDTTVSSRPGLALPGVVSIGEGGGC